MTAAFWPGRRVLVTGHTGFKGAWLCLWLERLGAEVAAFALPPPEPQSLWARLRSGVRSTFGDLRDPNAVRAAVRAARPQIVFHLAAQALVRESYREPLATFATNLLGTAHLLDACRGVEDLDAVIVVTSDKVYANDGGGRAFAEGDPLGGHDPYSASKACAELVTASYRASFFAGGPPIATARAGNVIGGGDRSPDRLVPDCVRALEAGEPVRLRYPRAVRPWQHVLDPLAGYLQLAQALARAPARTPRSVNFGPDPASFRTAAEVVDAFGAHFGGRPGWRADGAPQPVEAATLCLSSTLARTALGWRPRLSFEAAVAWTAGWQRAIQAGEDATAVTCAQIDRYVRLAATDGGIE